MKPFYQQVTWTVLAVGLYVLPYLVPALKDAEVLKQLATLLTGAVWLPSPPELAARRKARESVAPPT